MPHRPLGPKSADTQQPETCACVDDGPLTKALAQHHRGLERALDSIVVKAGGRDLRLLQTAYRSFEHELLEHLRVEEQELLPLYEISHGEDARALRDEHEVVRERLAVLRATLGVDSQTAEAARDLAALLRAHTAREHLALYPWLEQNLSHDMWLALDIDIHRGDRFPGSGTARN